MSLPYVENTASKKKRRKNKYKEYNLVLHSGDYLVFVALYRHRLLTIEELFRLVNLSMQRSFEPFRARLKKLCASGYLEQKQLSYSQVLSERKITNKKAYYLTEKGVIAAAKFLGIDSYSFDLEGVFNREYAYASDLKVNNLEEHHFVTQVVAVNAICDFAEYFPLEFYEHYYGYGEEFTLEWRDDENRVRKIYPDFLFIKNYGEHSYSGSFPIYIAIEADRNTEKQRKIEEKLLKYRNHVLLYKDRYSKHPLNLVMAVETQGSRFRGRIGTLSKNAFFTLEDVIYQNLINVYVRHYTESSAVVSSLYIENEHEISKAVVRDTLIKVVSQETAYSYKAELDGEQSIGKHNFKVPPSMEITFMKPGGETVSFICVYCQKGLVNDQARVLHFKKNMLPKSYVLAVYPKKSDIQEEMFILAQRRTGEKLSFGGHILLTSPGELEQGRLYQVETDRDKNTQRLRVVTIKDVIH